MKSLTHVGRTRPPISCEPLEGRTLLASHAVNEFTGWQATGGAWVTQNQTFTKTATVPDHTIVTILYG